ncbi:kielin/chordin-like protein [Anthonomus grandis grandis]|uniref:kielin/chordin-like protein n=1 Tax=Anthonomus grandis grandis TaxID=2921223 RepID=UPI002165F54C|nr:kielin/chordin-like protein [Anthonomus grandis grandis]XP_050299676.1 kielin/chordin-like protein [Anthonomus grandis grandis]
MNSSQWFPVPMLLFVMWSSQIIAIDPTENEIDHPESRGHPNPKMPASEMPFEVDILKLINVSHKDQGVSLVEGPIKNFPAFKFRLPYGNVALSNSDILTQALNSSKGFTVVFLYRQQKNNLGTLISLNSPGRITPWFQLTSNSKTGILSLKYRLRKSNKLVQVDWGLPRHHKKSPLAAWVWLSLSIDYQEDLIRLDLDCIPSSFESIPGKNGSYSRIGVPQDALVYFRQEPGRKKKFLGSIQVAKILPYVTHERLWNCMEIGTNISPEFQKPLV